MLAGRLPIVAAMAAVAVSPHAAAQTPIPPSAKDFAIGAVESDQYEIEAARVALAQSRDPRIRAFAQHMIDDHTRSSDDLRQAATASGLPAPPAAMSGDESKMLATLQSLTGADFDKAYVRQQILAHDQALAVSQSYASAGTDPNLRKAAQSAVPMIEHHLQMADQIRAGLTSGAGDGD
jgi:putative membrane protein